MRRLVALVAGRALRAGGPVRPGLALGRHQLPDGDIARRDAGGRRGGDIGVGRPLVADEIEKGIARGAVPGALGRKTHPAEILRCHDISPYK
ncbi:MAG: hypothetical protein HOC33_05165 [Alphaproteobacteria bacterium]|nr:hypothetical protein [Alphaproteobacteria bacterium]MBT4543217.1 hypothetical protein [Alphaproteobacteria bacterium]MBT6242637.1 hypothetical protein [Rhodospirillaceae bacterium]